MLKKFSQFMNEDFNAALQEPSSPAAAEARKLGLQYVGFGRYEDPNTQQITHVVQNDRLVPFSRAIKTNSFKSQSQDDYGNFTRQILPQIQGNESVLVDYYRPEYYQEDELDAIEGFTSTDFFNINQKLYSLPTGIAADQIQPDFDGDDIPQKVASLDSALARLKTPQEFLTYVGLGIEYDITNFVPGTQFTFKGFRSTTLNPNIALNYNSRVNKTANRSQTVLLQVKVKKGTNGMFVDDYSANPGESEFVLPRASKIKVLSGPNKLVGTNSYTGSNGLEVLFFDCELVK